MSKLAERVEAARRSWNAGDLDGYLSLYDDTIRLHGYSPEPMDKTGVRAFYEMIFATLTPPGRKGPQLDFFETLTDGSLHTCRFVMSGAHTGPFMGVPATGRPYALNGITILRFGDAGTVVERFSCADMLGLLVQIGAVPPPPA